MTSILFLIGTIWRIQLSKKQKTFCDLFSKFFKSILNFEHFQNRDEPHSLFIDGIMDSEKRG